MRLARGFVCRRNLILEFGKSHRVKNFEIPAKSLGNMEGRGVNACWYGLLNAWKKDSTCVIAINQQLNHILNCLRPTQIYRHLQYTVSTCQMTMNSISAYDFLKKHNVSCKNDGLNINEYKKIS